MVWEILTCVSVSVSEPNTILFCSHWSGVCRITGAVSSGKSPTPLPFLDVLSISVKVTEFHMVSWTLFTDSVVSPSIARTPLRPSHHDWASKWRTLSGVLSLWFHYRSACHTEPALPPVEPLLHLPRPPPPPHRHPTPRPQPPIPTFPPRPPSLPGQPLFRLPLLPPLTRPRPSWLLLASPRQARARELNEQRCYYLLGGWGAFALRNKCHRWLLLEVCDEPILFITGGITTTLP